MRKHRWKLGAAVLLSAAAIFAAYLHVTTPSGNASLAFLPSTETCFDAGDSKQRWSYCVHEAPQGVNPNTVYILHGRNKNAHTWNDDTYYTAQIQKQWETMGVRPPRVVVVSFGPLWLLTPKNSAAQSGLLDLFIQTVIPTIEARIGKPAKRFLMGESMGGLNALIVAMSTHGIFDRVISLCPVVYQESPFSDLAAIQSFIRRTGADPKTIYGIFSIAKYYMANEAEWKSISPLHLLDRVSASEVRHMSELYVSCGLYDKYGNYEGVELFAERAKKKGFKVRWHPLYGGHCAIDIASVAEELIR